MLILGIHSGWRDAGAALFDEYRPLAVVPLARASGIGHDGGRLPTEAVELCLEIAGALRSDIGGLALSHGVFPSRYFTGLPLNRKVGRSLRRLIGRDAPISLAEECRRSGVAAAEAMLDTASLLGDLGLNRHIPVRFHSESAAQGLLPLFQTDWQEALLFGAGSGEDGAAYSARILKYGRLADFYGDEAAGDNTGSLGRLIALAVDGLGLLDAEALFALSAYGEPILAQALLAHVRVDDEGHIHSDFSSDGGAAKWLRGLAEGHPPAYIAASLQKMLQDALGQAIERLLQRHEMSRVVLGGDLFANPRLAHALAMRHGAAHIMLHPDAAEAGLLGGVLHFLMLRDGLGEWLRHRAPLPPVPSGRDYSVDIDPVLGNAGCHLVSQDPWSAAAALLNAGRSVAFYGRQAFGARGAPARLILFAGTAPGMTGEICQRLDRPEATMPLVLTPRAQAEEMFKPPYDAAMPDSLAHAIAAPLAARWRSRLPAAMAPDFLCLPYPVDPDAEPQFSDLLDAYASLCGLPALLGLPIQVGDSAPLDAPADALRLLVEGRVDYIATEHAVWEAGG